MKLAPFHLAAAKAEPGRVRAENALSPREVRFADGGVVLIRWAEGSILLAYEPHEYSHLRLMPAITQREFNVTHTEGVGYELWYANSPSRGRLIPASALSLQDGRLVITEGAQ